MEYLSIPHYRGLKEKYDVSVHGDGIFFTTDTHEIIANNATYGETIDTWDIADGVLSLTMTSGKTLFITFDEATETAKGLLSAEDKLKLNSLDTELNKKVDKVSGKSLVSDTEITKLANLPDVTTLNANIADAKKAGTDALTNLTTHINNKSNPHSVTKSQIGLGNVTNDALVKRSEMGVANGVATLDSNGLVLESQLPSSVNDVLEYASLANFPTAGETGKIYIATDTNLIYRWTGDQYVEVSVSLALGETSTTAYAGDKGKDVADKLSKLRNTLLSHIKDTDTFSATAAKVTLNYDCYVGDLYGSTATSHSAEIPVASSTQAGIMTAADKLTLDSVDDTYATKSELTQSVSDLNSAISTGSTNSKVTVTETSSTSYAKSYVIKQGTTSIGTINIPKDMVVSSGSLETVTTKDSPYTGAVVGDKYIDLVIANTTSEHIYIPVSDLIDTYTAGTGLTLSGTTFNHKNSVTAGTALGDANKTLTFGGTFTIPTVSYDALGHITGKGTTTMTMPANPNTHYASKNVVGSSTATSNTTSALTNGNVYLNSVENGAVTSAHKISGSGATTVTTDTSGNIIINSTDNNTTYSAGTGISLSGTTFSNSGVRSIASGSTNGTISVNTNGTSAEVAVKGLGSAAYTASTAYAAASHTHTKSQITDFKLLLTSEDLDTIKSVGYYYAGGNNSVTNKPSGIDAFGLEVILSASGWYTLLLYASNGILKSYRRWYTSSAWTSWEEDKLTDTTYSTVSTSANGLMSSTDKSKLDSVASGAEVNLNAFSNVVIGSTTIAADSKTDSLTIVGSNVTLTPDATNDKLTIGITKNNVVSALGYTPGTSSAEPITYSLSKSGSTITLTGSDGTSTSVTDSNTTYSTATTSANGLMSSSDKSKLDGIASGAQVNQNAFSNVTVGSTTVAADSATDTLTLAAGSNITLTPDATNDKITIAATNTTYSAATSSTLGLVKSGTDITVDSSGNVSVVDNSHKHTVSNISDLTATASELNVLDGITATTAELNYTDGVTSNIQTQLNAKAPLASPALTGTPTAPTASAGTNSTLVATTAFVQTAVSNGLAASDAMIIKGTIGTGGTITALPTTYKTGWTYRVVSTGTYAGQVCEVGDLIIALVDRSGSGNVDSDWCVAQTNINGAITGVKSGNSYISANQSGSTVTLTHATGSGNNHVPSGGSTGLILSWESDGTAQWADVSSVAGDYLPLTGGTVSGNINVTSNPAAYKLELNASKWSVTAPGGVLAGGAGPYSITLDDGGNISSTSSLFYSSLTGTLGSNVMTASSMETASLTFTGNYGSYDPSELLFVGNGAVKPISDFYSTNLFIGQARDYWYGNVVVDEANNSLALSTDYTYAPAQKNITDNYILSFQTWDGSPLIEIAELTDYYVVGKLYDWPDTTLFSALVSDATEKAYGEDHSINTLYHTTIADQSIYWVHLSFNFSCKTFLIRFKCTDDTPGYIWRLLLEENVKFPSKYLGDHELTLIFVDQRVGEYKYLKDFFNEYENSSSKYLLTSKSEDGIHRRIDLISTAGTTTYTNSLQESAIILSKDDSTLGDYTETFIFSDYIQSPKIIKTAGTSSEILLADGSVLSTSTFLRGSISTVTVTSNLTNLNPASDLLSNTLLHVIYVNGGSSDYTIALTTSYKTPDGNALTLTCPKNGYCEANFMNIGGTIYARGV